MMRRISYIVMLIASIILLQSCARAKKNFPGSEYMPDMFHSIAYEANVYDYYYYNTWGTPQEYAKYAQPRKPVKGTIPFTGDVGIGYGKDHRALYALRGAHLKSSGSVPYYYEDTEDERTRAMTEITKNPSVITASALKNGKELYDVNCGICHGEKGDGNGYLARDDGAYPVQPANLISDEFAAASAGRFYHAIVYGKNAMGGYADKLGNSERWDVIHYIRSLQAKEKKLEYSPTRNTLNGEAMAYKEWKKYEIVRVETVDTKQDSEHQNNHGH